jgi:hypothetical protein
MGQNNPIEHLYQQITYNPIAEADLQSIEGLTETQNNLLITYERSYK